LGVPAGAGQAFRFNLFLATLKKGFPLQSLTRRKKSEDHVFLSLDQKLDSIKMVRFTDGITIYELKRGKITPRDEFVIALDDVLKKFSCGPYIPNADVHFLQQYNLTILYASPTPYRPDRIY